MPIRISWKLAKKRISTDRKMNREEVNGERFPIPMPGTCLGAAYENTTSSRVKAIERIAYMLLIRVVPPDIRSLGGLDARRFLSYRKYRVTVKC